ncbi:sulfate ABC transporter permease subunit CysT [Methylocella sp.]|uniref:sulfate ABC transporter permease subunit CysT n=1 Tax=Methylocella sp. TaxID=1978226 RepID=UPI0037831279
MSSTSLSLKPRSILPGFGLSLGYTLAYLGLVVLAPLAALALAGGRLGLAGVWEIGIEPRVFAALRASFTLALVAAAVNVVFGAIVAWTLTRYDFPGRRLLDAAVDLPFALPTAVAGVALTAIYAPTGWIGRLVEPLGWKVAFTPAGVVVALVFVGLPFIVRTVQPVILDLEKDVEEASASLGATRVQTLARVVLPALLPALLTGFALAFARGVGEYGSVIFIAGNVPFVSEIAPLLIVVKLEEFNYEAATAVALWMLAIAFLILLAVNLIQSWSRRRFGK